MHRELLRSIIFVPYCLLPVYVQDVGIRIHSIYLPSFVDNVTWQLTSGVNYEITIQTHNIGILYCLKIFMQNIILFGIQLQFKLSSHSSPSTLLSLKYWHTNLVNLNMPINIICRLIIFEYQDLHVFVSQPTW